MTSGSLWGGAIWVTAAVLAFGSLSAVQALAGASAAVTFDNPSQLIRGSDFLRPHEGGYLLADGEASGGNSSPDSVTSEGIPSELMSRAQAGDRDAQNAIGEKFEKGFGVAQNYSEAIKWYRRSAEQGLSVAQFNLGSLMYDGNGVARDLFGALGWFEKAAAQGDVTAQMMAERVREELDKPKVQAGQAELRKAILQNLSRLRTDPTTLRADVPNVSLVYPGASRGTSVLLNCPAGRASYSTRGEVPLHMDLLYNPFPTSSDTTDLAFVVNGDKLANFFTIRSNNSVGALYLDRIEESPVPSDESEECSCSELYQIHLFDDKLLPIEKVQSTDIAPAAIFISHTSTSFLFDATGSEYIPAQWWFLTSCRPGGFPTVEERVAIGAAQFECTGDVRLRFNKNASIAIVGQRDAAETSIPLSKRVDDRMLFRGESDATTCRGAAVCVSGAVVNKYSARFTVSTPNGNDHCKAEFPPDDDDE